MLTRVITFRTAAAAALLALSCVGMSTSSATPFVGKLRTASAGFTFRGSDSYEYHVSLVMQSAAATAPPSSDLGLQVQIAKCAYGTCASAIRYAKSLTASEGSIADDLSGATLKTTFAGAPLQITWTGSGSVQANISGRADPTGSGIGVSEPNSGDAGANGTVLGISCIAEGSIQGQVLVNVNGSPAVDGAPPPSSLPKAFRPTGSRRPACMKT